MALREKGKNVWRKAGSDRWYYDFMYRGERFFGAAGTSRSEAERTAKAKRQEAVVAEAMAAQAGGKAGKSKDITFKEASAQYMDNHGCEARNADEDENHLL